MFRRKIDLWVLISLGALAPLFFYKLGQSSLVSWDEAWYAEIARNILKTGDIFNLSWNGTPFYDHPPAGFWLMALAFKLFGVSDFWVRFPSAAAGLISLILIYFLGKELFNRTVGFVSAIALSSSFWFLHRARSGNLDSVLAMFFLLSLFLALRASKDKRYLIPLVVSLALLFLTKTLVPITIIPALVIIFWKVKIYRPKDLIVPALLFILLTGSWFAAQFLTNDNFVARYLSIGMPGVSVKTSYSSNFLLMKEYLHSGVGKWFWPGIFSLGGVLFFRSKSLLVLTVFFATFFLPTILSHKGHIWHLIPLHPILILTFFGFSYLLLKRTVRSELIIALALVSVSAYFSYMQVKRMWYEFIDVPAFVSDEEILSREAGRYPEEFIIDGDAVPTAVFYSEKKVNQVWAGGLGELFDEDRAFLIVTKQWRLDGAGIDKANYRIIKQDRDKILVQKI